MFYRVSTDTSVMVIYRNSISQLALESRMCRLVSIQMLLGKWSTVVTWTVGHVKVELCSMSAVTEKLFSVI